PSVLFPKFVTQYLQTNSPGLSIDDIGVTSFNRRIQLARWEDLPVPNALQNQTNVAVFTNLSASLPFLTNLFATFRLKIYSGTTATGNSVLDTGNLRMVDLNNRKFLLLTNNSTTLELWLAPYRSGVAS